MSRLEVESITWIHHVTHKLERNLPFTVLNVYQRPFALIQHEGQEVFLPLSNHRIGRIFLQIFHCKQIILSVSLTWFWEGPRKGLKWLTWTVVEIEIPRWHKTNGFYMVLREPYPEVEVQAWDKKSWRPVCRLLWMHNWSHRDMAVHNYEIEFYWSF